MKQVAESELKPHASRSNKETFVAKAKAVHGDKFDYSKVNYIKSSIKVCIKCNTCNKEFDQVPKSHLSGIGCPHCIKNSKLDQKEFERRAVAIHGKKYDYSNTVFEKVLGDITIKCKGCKENFTIQAQKHLSGYGCSTCVPKEVNTNNDFVKRSKAIHGDKYEYADRENQHLYSHATITCKNCLKPFKIFAWKHLLGKGCPNCEK